MALVRKTAWLVVPLLVLGLIAGCSRDPNVRKQKYLESGKRYFAKGQYKEAAIQFENAIQVDPRFAAAHYELSQTHMKTGMWQLAYRELARAVDLEPDNLKAQVDLGNLLLAGREFKGAMEKAELVLSKQPDNVDAHLLKANLLAVQGQHQEALAEIRRALELAPNDPKVWLNNAVLLSNVKDNAAAEASFKKVLSLDPKSQTALVGLAGLYQNQKRWPEAEQQLRAAVQLDPKAPQAYGLLARHFMIQGQRDKAEQFLKDNKSALADNPDGYRILADYYVATGEIDKALAEYASLYEQHKDDLKLKKGYVELLIARTRYDEAKRLTEEILKGNSKDVEGLLFRAQVMTREGQPKEAIEVLQNVLKTEPEHAVAQYELGLAYSRNANLAAAEKAWAEAVRIRPNFYDAHSALAQVAAVRGDYELLGSSSQEMIKLRPSAPDGYLLHAAFNNTRKNHAGVEADLQKAIEVAPQNAVGYARMGHRRLSQKKFPEALKHFEQALERDPGSTEALQGLAMYYNLQNQAAKGIERVHAQIAKSPNNSGFYQILGVLLFTSKDFDGAENAFRKAADLNNPGALLQLAQVQIARGSADSAIASYRKALAENPRDVRAHVLLGTLLESKGNFKEAQVVYQKALEVQPNYPPAANNLAYLMLEQGGNVDMAASLAQTARSGMPDSPNTADTLAWAYYHKGKYNLAIELLEEAVKKVPQNPTYHYHLGLAYKKASNPARAREHLQRALQIDSSSARSNDIRRELAGLGRG